MRKILLLHLFSYIFAYDITLYSLPNWDAKSHTLEISNQSCLNIPDTFLAHDRGVSSVWSKTSCVRLYAKANCEGDYLIVWPGALLNGQLASIDFDKRTKSSGPCEISQVKTITETVCVDYNTLICILLGVVNAGLLMFVAIDMHIEKRIRKSIIQPEKFLTDRDLSNHYEIVSGDSSKNRTRLSAD